MASTNKTGLTGIGNPDQSATPTSEVSKGKGKAVDNPAHDVSMDEDEDEDSDEDEETGAEDEVRPIYTPICPCIAMPEWLSTIPLPTSYFVPPMMLT